MKQKSLLRSMLLLFALIVGISSAWGQQQSFTTTFNSGISSTPYTGENLDLWNISKTGTTGYEDARGIQFQKDATGIFETKASYDNVSKVVVAVARSSKGAGTVKIYVNDVLKKTISSFSTSKTNETLTLNPGVTGKVKVEVNATASSIYIKSIEVTYTPIEKKNTTLTLEPTSLNLSYGGSTGTLSATVTPDGESALANPTIRWEVTGTTGVASVSGGIVTPIAEGTTEITAYYDGDNSYNSSSASATVTVTDNRTPVVSDIASIWSIKSLYIGGKHAFTPSVTLADGLSSDDVTYSYVSADPTTIQINDDGTYTALKTGSNIDITVTATPIADKLANYKPVSKTFQHNGAYKYSKPVFTPTGVTDGNFSGSMTLAIANDGTPVGPIYYTLDGEEPATDKSNGTLYSEELTLTATKTVKARVIDEDGYYSTVTSATYTKVPANKDAITLAVDQTLSFTDFTELGSYGTNEVEYIISSDGDKYKFTSTDVGCFNSKRMQIRDNASAYTTLSPVTAPYGFMMSVTTTQNNVDVYVGTSKQTAVNGIYYFSSGDAVTLKRNGGTTVVSNITITALKAPVATEVVITDPGTLAKDATGTFAYTATTEEANTASWTSATTSVITITNAATGAYTATGRGTSKIMLTLTPTDDTNYRAVTAERTVTVTAPVVITANDVEMTYGDAAKAIGATTSTGYAGTLIYESGNTSIATVDASGKVTAVAAGTTTITISAPADASHYYTAGDVVIIDVTVSAPAGGTTASEYTQTSDFYETLTSAASGWTYTNWTTSSSYGACSTAGTAGTLKTKDYLIPNKVNSCVFFEHTGKTFDDPSVACKLYLQEGSNTPVELTIPTYFTGSDWNYVGSGDIDISAYIGKTVHFIFDYDPSTDNEGKWEVKNFGIYHDIFGVKLNDKGYATYCSEYPLDFTDAEGYTAWQITDISSANAITFTKITGRIKGGQGILLKGDPNASVTLVSVDSENVLSSNKFKGTLAPTYIAAGEYYGLSGNTFVKVNAGTVPAGKALLPADYITDTTTGAPSFSFIFNDGETTSIGEEVMLNSDSTTNQWYDLTGRKLNSMPTTKGIYILNGKKVVVK